MGDRAEEALRVSHTSPARCSCSLRRNCFAYCLGDVIFGSFAQTPEKCLRGGGGNEAPVLLSAACLKICKNPPWNSKIAHIAAQIHRLVRATELRKSIPILFAGGLRGSPSKFPHRDKIFEAAKLFLDLSLDIYKLPDSTCSDTHIISVYQSHTQTLHVSEVRRMFVLGESFATTHRNYRVVWRNFLSRFGNKKDSLVGLVDGGFTSCISWGGFYTR